MLKKIKISNFKSLSDRTVSLNKLNVLIGANAAGKSNFVDAIRFIHEIITDRVSKAVGKRLGWTNVITRGKDKSSKISVEIRCDLSKAYPKKGRSIYKYKPIECTYKFEAGYSRRKYFLESEFLEARLKIQGKEITESFNRSRSKVQILESELWKKQKTISISSPLKDIPFLQSAWGNISSIFLSNLVKNWRFYDLDVNAARRPCIEETEDFLLDDGHNLASVLDRLKTRSSQKIKKRILDLMSILVPSFEGWKTEYQFDGSLGFTIKEKGIEKPLLPKMVSDGTIRLLSLLLALLYQPSQPSLICIDEPERYLHPQVLETLVEIMRDISNETQIIVTTHSSELVKWLQPDEVLMVDKIDGITRIARAQDISMINKFIEEFSLDELWLKGYLEGGKVF